MKKVKLPLTILCFAYCGVSFLSLLISMLSGVILGNSGGINIMVLFNWIVGIVPFVLILLCGLGFKNKIIMLVSLVLPLINCTKNLLELVAQGIKLLFADAAVTQFYSANMLTSIFGATAYVLLILYLLKVFKNKTFAMTASIVYFALNFILYLLSGLSLIINRFLADFFDKYALFFTTVNTIGIISVALSCAVWIIYINTLVLKD